MVNSRIPMVLENAGKSLNLNNNSRPGKSLNLNKNSRPGKSLKIDKVLANPGIFFQLGW
jgi:hypothetical protein